MNEKYIEKKLAPFVAQERALEAELAQLVQELKAEDLVNDQLFNDFTTVEKQLADLKIEQKNLQERSDKRHQGLGNEKNNQNLDGELESKVKSLLNSFLLRESKREKLEHYLQVRNRQIQEDDAKFEEEDEPPEGRRCKYFNLHYRLGGKPNVIEVPESVETFADLRKVIANFENAHESEVFFTDQLGNLILFNMRLLPGLYPPVYDLLRNYEPMIGVELVKPPKKDEEIQPQQPTLFDEGAGIGQRTYRQEQKRIQKIDWGVYLGYLSQLKYLFESILFLTMLVCFLFVEIDEKGFQESNQLFWGARSTFSLPFSMREPVLEVLQNVSYTLQPKKYEKRPSFQIFPTVPLKAGIYIQRLATKRPFDQCHIQNKNHKKMMQRNNKTCIDYQSEFRGDIELEGEVPESEFNPKVYDSEKQGYVWKLDVSSLEGFQTNLDFLVNSSWVKYNQNFGIFVFNYYNAPTNRLLQVKLMIDYIFNDTFLNRNSREIQVYDLNSPNAFAAFVNSLLFYIAIILLIFSVFDFFSIQLKNSKHNLIILYNEVEKLETKFKRLRNRQQPINPEEEHELEQKQRILDEYWVIYLKIIYLIIKRPLVFDWIYMLSFLGILIRDTINATYATLVEGIDIQSQQYQDLDKLMIPNQTKKVYSAVLCLFLMTSVVRFLGNWSPYLKCYGLVMVRFNKQSYFYLVILIFIISICSMSWIVSLQGALVGHTDFVYSFLGLLRCTLKFGMHNQIHEQDLPPNPLDAISYSFETRYLQYVIVVVVPMVMVPIFISLMVQQVHDTKQEAKEKLLELQRQEEEKQKAKPKNPYQQ